jgi:hypothetical protein
MSSYGVLNDDLARAVEQVEHRRLAVCAHEIGHGFADLAGGGWPEKVWLKFDILGGFKTGWWQPSKVPSRDWSRDRKIGYLVALIGGHAAEVRFCRLYLGMNDRAAYKFGRDWADGDYADFDHWKSKLGLGGFSWSGGLSASDAFERATAVHEQRAEDLDRLTLRLHHNRHLTGDDLTPHTSRSRRGWFF